MKVLRLLVLVGTSVFAGSSWIQGGDGKDHREGGAVVDGQPYRITTEVRIKRMHLARPDLMAYPVLQEYYA